MQCITKSNSVWPFALAVTITLLGSERLSISFVVKLNSQLFGSITDSLIARAAQLLSMLN
ncbi:hypothetical protein CWC18_20665 [Pseudoalteromonas aurantia]|uniref:Uncharacterized protein n=1 Tax=Pseudoalteromonas aurantia TaxID=43654 RepID=A0A5S3V4T2_9GAMM|nr:hypothetical protein CWC18_20665 [Pseudoalteromonas aurantia]TMO65822.1 hypothetical protein CWC19_17190 [Pseudoalteromonas aurantia]TMO73443.1 hypothetical protein CWC20_13230 [Pseudoalteromonas aurantia]